MDNKEEEGPKRSHRSLTNPKIEVMYVHESKIVIDRLICEIHRTPAVKAGKRCD